MNEQDLYWWARRTPMTFEQEGSENLPTLVMDLVNAEFEPADAIDGTLDIQMTCCNRDVPSQLDPTHEASKLQLAAGGATGAILMLSRPTPSQTVVSQADDCWNLISQLIPNSVAVTNPVIAAEHLQQKLRIQLVNDSAIIGRLIDSIAGMATCHVVEPRQANGDVTFVRGVELRIEIDDETCADLSPMLFLSVIERLLTADFKESSFCRLIAFRKDGNLISRWPARCGKISPL